MKMWNGKICKLNIVVYILFMAIFKPYFLPTKIQQLAKLCLLAIVFLYIIANASRKVIFNYSLILCVSVLISSTLGLLNGYCDTLKGYLDSIQYALCIYCLFTLALYSASKNRLEDFVKCFFKITLVYMAFILIFAKHPLGIDEADLNLKVYVMGNKFSSCYYFTMFVGLFCCLYYRKILEDTKYKIYFVVVSLIAIGTSIFFDTTTLAFASAVPAVLVFLPNRVKEKMYKKQAVLITCIVSAILPFLFSFILKIELVQVLIRDILHKRLDLTGRMEIYTVHLIPELKERLFWGRGYHNTAIKDVCIYTNAQNGLLQYAINFGFVGAIILVWFLLVSIRKAKKNSVTIGALLIIYSLLAAAVLEISINWYFFTGFAIIFANKKEVKNISESGV